MAHRTEFRDLIGRLLLASAYLDRYLSRPDLDYDQPAPSSGRSCQQAVKQLCAFVDESAEAFASLACARCHGVLLLLRHHCVRARVVSRVHP
ncbi:hypothetical protein OG594_42275 [Streptomyces sp. NBC_01214]|uniref:hypothetical protein n=1 Tax=Streptomyces sp. NBC_01214 TaxID=2903777 RepID=UPI0022579D26|nr:hypothetical protein [Streptomyces sp. NBC_01214]MCX4808144.1 hypothetical protein [Streptomyces sp. NBC_01214]